MQDLTVEDGREYVRSLMERNTRYQGHPMHKEKKANSKPNISTAWEERCVPLPPGRMMKAIWKRMSCAGMLVPYHAGRVYTTVEVIREMLSYYLTTSGLHMIAIVDYWQAMAPSTRLLGKDIEALDVVREVNLGSLKDLANDWRVPFITVAVEKTAWIRQ